MNNMDSRYLSILKRAVFSSDPEEALCDAAALGSDLLKRTNPPENAAEIHHNALLRLAQEYPDLKLSEVVDRLTTPLIEVSMAYSLAFRWQQEEKEARGYHQAQVSRLEALGTLAAGIGHDFNTILGVINGYAELLRDDATLDSYEWKNSQRILDASERARGLISRMLTFARQAPVELQRVDAIAALKGEIELVRAAVPSTVEITFTQGLAQAYLMATPSQIHQMVMNLCLNASHAMNGQGALGIEVKPSVLRLNGAPPVPCLSLSVTDTGCGMSPQVQKRVLEPFFTTRAPGKGSGLGLSVVFGIVSDLGGEMHIQSEVGVGTRFSIDLPLLALNAPVLAFD